MLFIVTALMIEASPIIQHYGLKRDMTTHAFPVYRRDDVVLIISGVGKVRCAMATTWLYAAMFSLEQSGQPLLLVNIGFCGTDRPDIPSGRLVLAGKVTDRDSGRDFYPDVRRDDRLPLVTLYCSGRRVTAGHDPAAQPGKPVWVDMESAGFMEAAGHFVTADRILVFKIVSDHLEPDRLDKKYLQQLMCDQMPVLTQVLNEAVARVEHDNHTAFPAELDDAVAQLIQKQRFTSAMGRQLLQAARQFYVAGKDPLPVLHLAMNETVSQKTEGKRLFARIFQKLQS